MKRLLLLWVFLLLSFSLHAQNFWESLNGPSAGSVNSLAINSDGVIFAGTYGSGVYRSTDNGNSWTQDNNTTLSFSYVSSLVINDSGVIFAGTEGNGTFGSTGNGVFRSTDNGNNWTQANSGLTNVTVLSLMINSDGNILAGTMGNGIFISTDNGNTWTNNGNSGNCYALARNISINSPIFAGTNGAIYRSTDNGNSWIKMYSYGIISYGFVTSLAINSKGNIFAGNNYYWGIYRSTDNGNNWTQLYKNVFDSVHVNSLAINGSGDIFAGTFEKGIYRSTDNGNNWTQINSGLTDSYVPSLAINNDEFIFAGTHSGNGVFRTVKPTAYSLNVISSNGIITKNPNQAAYDYGTTVSLTATPITGYNFTGWSGDTSGSSNPLIVTINGNKSITANYVSITSIKNKDLIPIKYNLSQNFPNPFNPITTIYYSLPASGLVSISVYDILGKEVATLVNEEKTAGNYSIQFNGNNLSSGIYFYRMQAGDFVDTKKLILLK